MMNAPEPNLQEQLGFMMSIDPQLVAPSPEQKAAEDNFWRGPPRGVLAKNMMRSDRAMTNTYKIDGSVKKTNTSGKEGGLDKGDKTSGKKSETSGKEPVEGETSGKEPVQRETEIGY
jgi:hypothetical protein